MEILTSVPDELFSESFADDVVETSMTPLADDDLLADSQGELLEELLEEVLEEVIDDVIFGFCLEVHRMTKKGILFLTDMDPQSIEEFKIIDIPGLDVFGQELKKKSLECVCPNCARNMAASRFAPHLEKCMGMGRSSSRVASRRIATNITKHEESDTESFVGDNDNDNDWATSKKTKKLRREKHSNSPRGRGRPPNTKSQRAEAAAGELTCQMVLQSMTNEDRKVLLQSICGVISQSPGRKLCTRTGRCHVHTDEQRQASRNFFLTTDKGADDEVHVDIDTYDDLDGQALRDALWDRELTPTASPADSTSTVNSSSSKKRGRRKGKRRHDKKS